MFVGEENALEGRSRKWDAGKPETAVKPASVAGDASTTTLSSPLFSRPCISPSSCTRSFSRFLLFQILFFAFSVPQPSRSLRIEESGKTGRGWSAGHTDGNSRDSQFQYNQQAVPPYVFAVVFLVRLRWGGTQFRLI